jgi:hypothetical protein
LEEKPTTVRQRAEVEMTKRRKALQDARLVRNTRRYEWQDRLDRQALRVEESYAERKRWGLR